MSNTNATHRNIGLLGATSVGVGALVGGGILALSGISFAITGPSTILVFALNGVIAILTALSFSELATAFPQSGGAYSFAKRILSVRAAFMVGWLVWFASIVAGVLYAQGFAVFAAEALLHLGFDWLAARAILLTLACLATAFYTWELSKSTGGGGDAATYGKVVLFAFLVAVGLWVLFHEPVPDIRSDLRPFFTAGVGGFIQALGLTVMALQGFDLIAAVAGEIKEPEKTIPRAMLLSLAIALVLYLPLLLVVMTVGVPDGSSISELSQTRPETVFAVAIETFMGKFGYWLVLIAGILAMLSALRANILAASRIAQQMAKDSTLPAWLRPNHATWGTPFRALLLSAVALLALLFVLPDVAAAGAAASLIFLLTFALVHGLVILVHQRAKNALTFRVKFYPLVPLVGGLACLGLAVFQGIVVPAAGVVTLIWLALGMGMYLSLLARAAQTADVINEALDPQLLQLRGRSPLTLVPIANPENAAALVGLADALRSPVQGRVMLLTVAETPSAWEEGDTPEAIDRAIIVQKRALNACYRHDLRPQALLSVAEDPWQEMGRIARTTNCETLMLGFSKVSARMDARIENLLNNLQTHVVILRAPEGWDISCVSNILVPVAGNSQHDLLRVRLLTSLLGNNAREGTFLRVLPEDVTDSSLARAQRALSIYAKQEVWGNVTSHVMQHSNVQEALLEQAQKHDLMIIGAERHGRAGLGTFVQELLAQAQGAVMVISYRR